MSKASLQRNRNFWHSRFFFYSNYGWKNFVYTNNDDDDADKVSAPKKPNLMCFKNLSAYL